LLFVQNVTGYMVGKVYEQRGIIKHGAMMINAVSNSKVPHVTLQIGASYGAGNYGMCGRAYNPRFLFTWPNSKTAVMGPQQLAGVLSIVSRQAAAAAGRPFDEQADAFQRAYVENQIEQESLAVFNSARVYDDGIIDPRDSCVVLMRSRRPTRKKYAAPASSASSGCEAVMRKVLIANRGEIARRIARTCREMGIGTVAVFSEPDRSAPFVGEADEAVALGGAAPSESYLRIDKLIDAARRTGADAIHPGYGFLAENAELAERGLDAGLVFIGPPPAVISAMGSKLEAKRRMTEAGVPMLPSGEIPAGNPATNAATRTADLDRLAKEIGLPLLIKASAGGGGKGMRIVREAGNRRAVASARREPNRLSATEPSTSSATSKARHVECRSSVTRTVMSCISASASARSSAATKRSSRSRPAWCSIRPGAKPCATPRFSAAGRSATSVRAPWSSSLPPTGASTSSR
jgi:hypothetical protein